MARRILYFINPISGPKRYPNLQQIITDRTVKAGADFDILYTDKDGNYSFLADKIKKQGITDVVVCGGDGTVNQIAAALPNCAVNIGIIPMGSGNGLAYCAKIPKAIEKALDIIITGKAIPVDAFLINDKFSCMLCGIGLDAQVAHDFSLKTARGLTTYILESIRNFFKAPPYSFTITVDEVTIDTEAYFISIANSNQFGNNFKIAPKACLSDGLIDVVIVNKMAKTKMLWAIWKQLMAGAPAPATGLPIKKQDVIYFQTDKLTISNPGSAPLHIDGDPALTSKDFEIRVIPNAFKLLQP
jgi:diacylglycerol kinase (ATP)